MVSTSRLNKSGKCCPVKQQLATFTLTALYKFSASNRLQVSIAISRVSYGPEWMLFDSIKFKIDSCSDGMTKKAYHAF